MGKQAIRFGDIEVEKYIFQQHKIPPSISDVDNNQIIVSNKARVGKKVSNILLVTKMMKKLNRYV